MPAAPSLADQPRTSTDLPPATPERNAAVQRLVLTGFMGAGKSTVGRILADQLHWRFLDVDREIEARAGMTVAEIFAKLGEFVFRRLETSAIAHALGEREVIIALGGGAPEVLANRLLLEQTPGTAVVLLDAPLDTLFSRCAAQTGPAAERPNLPDRSTAEDRFRYRTPLYRRIARKVVHSAAQTPQQTAAEVLSVTGLR